MMVEVGAVEAGGVGDVEFALVAPEFGVQTADGEVIEVDVTAGMTTSGGDGLVQREP